MARGPFLIAVAVVLGACATVSNETKGTIEVDGRSYEMRFRVNEGSDGQYTTASVRVNSMYYRCLADSPGDCEATVRFNRSRFDR